MQEKCMDPSQRQEGQNQPPPVPPKPPSDAPSSSDEFEDDDGGENVAPNAEANLNAEYVAQIAEMEGDGRADCCIWYIFLLFFDNEWEVICLFFYLCYRFVLNVVKNVKSDIFCLNRGRPIVLFYSHHSSFFFMQKGIYYGLLVKDDVR